MKYAITLWIAIATTHAHAGDLELALVTTFEVLVALEVKLQADIEQKDNATLLITESYSKCLNTNGASNSAQCDGLAKELLARHDAYQKLKTAQRELEARTNAVILHATTVKKMQYDYEAYRNCLFVWQRGYCNNEFIGLLQEQSNNR